MDKVDLDRVTDKPGIFTFTERGGADGYLYVGSSDNIGDAVKPFEAANPFLAVAGQFWKPDPARITLKYAVADRHHKILGTSMRNVGLRLIEYRHPLFNMPVHLSNGGKAA